MNIISRPRRYGIWIVLLLVGAGAAYYWMARGKHTEVTTLETAPIERGDLLETISSTGTLAAAQEVTVGSQISGIVTKVLVDFNSAVKQGELLAVVDPQTLQAQLTVARAALARAQANYDEAQRQLQEGMPLREQGYLSARDLRTLEVAVQTTKTQLDSAVSDFNKQNVQLQYAEIRSPIDGVVMSRTVDPGNTVQASMQAPTLFVVASDLRKMKIMANVDETQITAIRNGMLARFSVSGIADKTFNAIVRQIRLKSTNTNNVVTYTVVLDADNSEQLLFPGMTATLDFIVANLQDKLLVPNGALRLRIPEELRAESLPAGAGAGVMANARAQGTAPRERDGARAGKPDATRAMLWRVNAQGKAERLPVRIIGSDLTMTAVEPLRPQSLQAGDAIVTRVIEPKGAAGGNAQNRMMGGGFGPPGFGGGGGGGGGGGPR